MTIDWELPVQTKAGFPVQIISTTHPGPGCVAGLLGTPGPPLRWTIGGQIVSRGLIDKERDLTNFDLMNVPAHNPAQTSEAWITIYRDGGGYLSLHSTFYTKKSALNSLDPHGAGIVGVNKITLRAEFDEG